MKSSSSCGTALVRNVLGILFISSFSQGVDAHHTPSNLVIDPKHVPRKCSSGGWWSRLNAPNPDPLGHSHWDPCEQLNNVRANQTISVTCCFDEPESSNSTTHEDDASCGPCNLQTFNLASACAACALSPDAIPDDTQLKNDYPGAFKTWKAHENPFKHFEISGLPRWTNVSVTTNDVFDVQKALQVAAKSPPSPSGGEMVAPTQKASSSQPSSRAGAIAGGVIGGLVFMTVLAFIMIFIVIRRRRHRSAPSAAYADMYGPSPFPSAVGDPTYATFHLSSLQKMSSFDAVEQKKGKWWSKPWDRDIEKY